MKFFTLLLFMAFSGNAVADLHRDAGGVKALMLMACTVSDGCDVDKIEVKSTKGGFVIKAQAQFSRKKQEGAMASFLGSLGDKGVDFCHHNDTLNPLWADPTDQHPHDFGAWALCEDGDLFTSASCKKIDMDIICELKGKEKNDRHETQNISRKTGRSAAQKNFTSAK